MFRLISKNCGSYISWRQSSPKCHQVTTNLLLRRNIVVVVVCSCCWAVFQLLVSEEEFCVFGFLFDKSREFLCGRKGKMITIFKRDKWLFAWLHHHNQYLWMNESLITVVYFASVIDIDLSVQIGNLLFRHLKGIYQNVFALVREKTRNLIQLWFWVEDKLDNLCCFE